LEESEENLHFKYNESKYNAKSAQTFTKEDFLQLYEMPSTHSNLLLKVFCIVALHIAARNCEAVYLTWNCLEILHNDKQEKSYKLNFKRKKRRENIVPHAQFCIITGEVEVLLIYFYQSFFFK